MHEVVYKRSNTPPLAIKILTENNHSSDDDDDEAETDRSGNIAENVEEGNR